MRLPKLRIPERFRRTGNDADDGTPKKSWIMLGVAITLGVGGVYLANSFIQGQIARHEAELRAGQQLIKVVVPKRDLPRGLRISAQDLAVREIPNAYVHNGVVTPDKFSIADGQRLSFQVDKGKPLLWAHLESGSIPTFSGKLPDGMRAITVPVDQINSISGLLQPKDKIDLLLTFAPYKKKITFPLLQDVLVLATGAQVNTEQYADELGILNAKSYNTVTLQVTPEDAKRIVLAREAGKLTAVLRHPDDTKEASKKRISVASLLNTGAAPRRGVEMIIGGR